MLLVIENLNVEKEISLTKMPAVYFVSAIFVALFFEQQLYYTAFLSDNNAESSSEQFRNDSRYIECQAHEFSSTMRPCS